MMKWDHGKGSGLVKEQASALKTRLEAVLDKPEFQAYSLLKDCYELVKLIVGNCPEVTYTSKAGKTNTYFLLEIVDGIALLQQRNSGKRFRVPVSKVQGIPENFPGRPTPQTVKHLREDLPQPQGRICRDCGERFVAGPDHKGYVNQCLDCFYSEIEKTQRQMQECRGREGERSVRTID
jgi:hypothetical protein